MLKYYEILDIPDNSGTPAIEQAYRCQSKAYHPDKVHHLGTAVQALASAKMMLINEAYRVLSDPLTRMQYHRNPGSFHSPGFFSICRSCGFASWVSDHNELHALECPSCHHRFTSQDELSGGELWKDPGPILIFLELSHRMLDGSQLPSSLQLLIQEKPVMLDKLPDGRWCLFTQSQVMFEYWDKCGLSGSRQWDEDLQTGFLTFNFQNLRSASDKIRSILNNLFSRPLPAAALTPMERRDGVAEPNALLLSALSDISIVSARERWTASGGNLFSCKARLVPGWQKRLEELFVLVHVPKRRHKTRSISQIKTSTKTGTES